MSRRGLRSLVLLQRTWGQWHLSIILPPFHIYARCTCTIYPSRRHTSNTIVFKALPVSCRLDLLAMVLLHLECLTALVGDHPTHRLALLSVFSILSYFIIKRVISSLALGMAYKANHCQRPPKYPHKDPIFGLDFIFDSITGLRTGRLLDTQAGHFRRAGANTFYTWVLGRQAIVTMEPENIKAILATNFKDYMIGGRKDILGSLLGNGIFVLDGEEWAHSRALLRPNFVRDQLADLDMFERHIQELFHVLPRDSSVVELQQLLLRFTMDSATEFLFGHSTSTLTDATAADEEFREALTFSLRSLSKRIQRGPLNQFLPRETAEELRAHKTCRDYVNIFVDQAMGLGEKTGSGATEGGSDEETGRYYFLKELIRAFDDKERICDELLSILLAGRDTTAALLSNVFHVLSRRPDLWHKLRNEVQDFSGNPPSYAQLRNLRFSKYIINESKQRPRPIQQPSIISVSEGSQLTQLVTALSSASLSSNCHQLKEGCSGHYSSYWRWSERHFANLHSQGHPRSL